jgi:hypothetical protein
MVLPSHPAARRIRTIRSLSSKGASDCPATMTLPAAEGRQVIANIERVSMLFLAINTYPLLTGSGTSPAVRTGSVLVLTLIALWVLVVLSRPLNRWRALIIGVMYAALALVLTVPPLRDFF